MDVALVAIANGFLCAASMAFNDWHDVREDAINEPTRPIVAGRIGRSAVLQLASTLSLLGVVIAWTAPGWRFGAVAVGVVGASVAYSMRLKSIPLVGNITTAIVHSFPFWCWLLWEVEPLGLYLPLCLVVLADRFGAEVIKTSEDVRGDRMSDIDTVATRWGPVRAMVLGCASLVLAAVAGGGGRRRSGLRALDRGRDVAARDHLRPPDRSRAPRGGRGARRGAAPPYRDRHRRCGPPTRLRAEGGTRREPRRQSSPGFWPTSTRTFGGWLPRIGTRLSVPSPIST